MVRDYFPSLVIRQKWHTERRDLQEGDIILMKGDKLIRGNWRLGRVTKMVPSSDGRVRRVIVCYKHQDDQTDYKGKKYASVERSSLVVIVPIDEAE